MLLVAAGGGGANRDYAGVDSTTFAAGSSGGGGGGYTKGTSGKLSGNSKTLIGGVEHKNEGGYGWDIWNDIDSSISGDDSSIWVSNFNSEYDWYEIHDRNGRHGQISGNPPETGAYRFGAYAYSSHGMSYFIDSGYFNSTVSGGGSRTIDYSLSLMGQTSRSMLDSKPLSEWMKDESTSLWSLNNTYFEVYTDKGLLQRVSLGELAQNNWAYKGISCSFSRGRCHTHNALNQYNNGLDDHSPASKWSAYDTYNSCGIAIHMYINIRGVVLPDNSNKVKVIFHGERLKPQQNYESSMSLAELNLLWGGRGGEAGDSYNISDGYEFTETRGSNSGNGWAKITWLEPGNYTVTLDKDSGVSSVSGDGEYEADTNVSISAALKTGYEFVRWETSTSGFSNSTSNPYTFSLADNVTYKAISAAKKYTLNFDYNKSSNATSTMAGNSTTSKTVTYDSAIGDLPTPSMIGWKFDGWVLKSSSINKDTVWKYDEDNLTAYAQWTPNTYDVIYKKGSSAQ